MESVSCVAAKSRSHPSVTRAFISAAALSVKVSRRTWSVERSGRARKRLVARATRVDVFPVPAEASTARSRPNSLAAFSRFSCTPYSFPGRWSVTGRSAGSRAIRAASAPGSISEPS